VKKYHNQLVVEEEYVFPMTKMSKIFLRCYFL